MAPTAAIKTPMDFLAVSGSSPSAVAKAMVYTPIAGCMHPATSTPACWTPRM